LEAKTQQQTTLQFIVSSNRQVFSLEHALNFVFLNFEFLEKMYDYLS